MKITAQMTTEQFDKALSSAVSADEKVRDTVQKLCVQAIMQAALHGNIEFVKKIHSAFSKSKSLKAGKIIGYLTEWAPVTYNQKSGFAYDRESANVLGNDMARLVEVMEALHASPWYEFKLVKDAEPVDILKKLEALVKAVERAQEAEVLVENLTYLEVAINAINNLKGSEIIKAPAKVKA